MKQNVNYNNSEYASATNSEHNTENHNEENANVFDEVFSNLGDHNGFYVGPYHICDLPYIFWDDGQLHCYANKTSLKEAGVFTEVNHKIVKSSDGESPQLDLSVTNLVMFQWIAMFFIFAVFKIISRKKVCKPDKAPKGFFANAVEKIIIYVREEVVYSNFSDKKIAKSLTFYFVATLIFILVINLLGLLPGGHTATAAIPVTAALAIVAFFVINGAAIKYSGVKHWFKHLLGGAPIGLAPIMIPIEILGLIIKPFSLTIRLFANMTAGHIVLFSLLGLLFFANTYVLSLAIVPFSVFIYILELLVAFIQAFVFTMLVSIYAGQSIGEHSHKEEH
ncbi:MAG: F0F1 ATP synthase subunit A [Bacteroidetes bacterium]|nr:F0F1 ATP synthase subunit A [Bacteroidota bacterium]